MNIRKPGFRQDERGVTAVEVAITLPVFLLLLFAIIDFGLLYFNYSRVERGVFLAQKTLAEGKTFGGAAEMKKAVCEEAGIDCREGGFALEVKPLSATPGAASATVKDGYEVKPGQVHVIRASYPWASLLPGSVMGYIGLDNLENRDIQVGVFFYVKKQV